jgi:hypothetical protein
VKLAFRRWGARNLHSRNGGSPFSTPHKQRRPSLGGAEQADEMRRVAESVRSRLNF